MSVTNLKPFLDMNDIVIWHGKLDGKMLIAITNYLSEVCLVYIENKSPMQLSFEDWDNFNGSIEQYIYYKFGEGQSFIDNMDSFTNYFHENASTINELKYTYPLFPDPEDSIDYDEN